MITEYNPQADDNTLSLRDLQSLLDEVTTIDDLRLVRRFVNLLCEGLSPEEAWDAMGLTKQHGPFSDGDGRTDIQRWLFGRRLVGG